MKSVAFLGAALALGGLVGCSALVGIGDLPATGETSGRDGGGGGGGDVLLPFLGTWTTTTTSSDTVACSGKSETNADSYTLTMTRGVASDLLANTPGCNLKANASGTRTAAVVAGQTCTSTGNGEVDQITYTGGTFAVSADGKTASIDLTGTVIATSANGSASCTFSQSDEFTKQ